MEESPEQVLARLERHRDAVFRARGLLPEPRPAPAQTAARDPGASNDPVSLFSSPAAAPPPVRAPQRPPSTRLAPAPPTAQPPHVAAPAGVWGTAGTGSTPTEFIPHGGPGASSVWRPTESAVLVTLFGLFIAAVAATVEIVAFEHLGRSTALGIAGVMTLAGLVAAARRVPTALWWTIGAVIGGVLGHWS